MKLTVLPRTGLQGVLDELSYYYSARPFKSPAWQLKKDSKPRAKNTKQILTAERERAPRRLLDSGEKGEQFGCACRRSCRPSSGPPHRLWRFRPAGAPCRPPS